MAKSGSAFCLPYCKTTNRFLLEYRSEIVGNPNTYGFFGGGAIKGEDPVQTVCREFFEETGFRVKHGFDYAIELNKKKHVHLFVKILRREFEPILSPESSGFRWVRDVEDVKPLHPMIIKYYGVIRRLMEATRQASEHQDIKTGISNAK